MTAHILVVDDEPDICALVQEILEDEGYNVSVAEDAETARQLRQERRPDLILLDIWMPDTDGITLLREWQDGGLVDVPVIMMSGHGSVETAVESTRIGAFDFIEKPIALSRLLNTLERALSEAVTNREKHFAFSPDDITADPLGHSESMTELRDKARRMSQHPAAVLLIGEPGSGRSLFARYLHNHSPRQTSDFVSIRVAGMNAETQMLELFGSTGHEATARLAQASGGTLFIKDIAEMDNTVQARLLSSLENAAFIPDGGVEPISLDVRIIAATAYDLDHAVSTGRLREDLYYHLNIVPLHIPPLREHCEDVPELLDFYVNQFVTQEQLPYRRFTLAAQNRLRNYHWPGNVRELKNLVQRLLILGSDDDIQVSEVEPTLNTQKRNLSTGSLPIFDLPLREAREQFERAYLEHQL
ncbi:MAG: sigma-54 dependent transcriptional regulator, partial [Pseudomonadota bacterium]